MTFGKPLTEENAHNLLDWYSIHSKIKPSFDTANIYTDGASEKILGSWLTSKSSEWKAEVATKVNPWPAEQGGGCSLSASHVKAQVETSLGRLQRKQVDILYLHTPDHNTPIEETLAALDELHKAGVFKELGLSNYSAWQVVEIWHICKANGYVLPTVYQGMYNAFTRAVEDELFPAIRKYQLRFYAYNPLAGGMLTGKYNTLNQEPHQGRFVDKPHYRQRFWLPSYFNGIDLVKKAMSKAKCRLSLTEASLRWLALHSKLRGDAGDAIIIGGSSKTHFQENVNALTLHQQEPLPPQVVQAFDRAWRGTKPDCFSYFR